MELMIVIVIIGVLAAIGVPAYKNYVTEAKKSACNANRHTIATALGMYYAENAEYTSDFGQLSEYVLNIDKIKECPAGTTEAVTDATYVIKVESGNIVVHCPHTDHEDLIVGTGTLPSEL
jgi:Tfp pilus assembly protein PilE